MNIAVLVSGGVDSSVVLALLKEAGHEVTAFYLKIWLEDELAVLGDCPWAEDLSYIQAVCDMLHVSLEIVPLQREYQERVVAYTLAEIKAGRTPNPDMLCNVFIKCGAFFEFLDTQCVTYAFDKVATGHYAHIYEKDGSFYLQQTRDLIKDQTYFLARLTQEQLRRICFPLGIYTKEEVRVLAQKYNLATQARKDSQGLCFLGKISFRDFIKSHVGVMQGNLIEYETGEIIGTHEGFWFYTHGQRQGLGLAGGPWYVVKKNAHTNSVYISKTYHEPDKQRDSFYVCDLLWVYKPVCGNLYVKIRHGKQLHKAFLTVHKEDVHGRFGKESLKICSGEIREHFFVQLAERDQGIAPGQFAVFYDQDGRCVGSGKICDT